MEENKRFESHYLRDLYIPSSRRHLFQSGAVAIHQAKTSLSELYRVITAEKSSSPIVPKSAPIPMMPLIHADT
ncbi:hypothetical protein J6590_034172 [Homalodisca vitripennis]|nr:hypothetical protein J6590_034172 [Homalodisca vitripennis]